KGEKFSPWLGLLRRFEIIYVAGSERDIIGVRNKSIMTKEELLELANILLPNVDKDISYYQNIYKTRNCNFVSRFAPSPTGYMHIGGIYQVLIAEKFVHQNDGIFFLRIEDTDKKREIEGAFEKVLQAFDKFGISYDEGPISNDLEKGNYGPYIQSKREEIYQTFVKHLIKNGLAYPCFMSEDEINETRNYQQKNKLVPGIYGEFSKYRDASIDEVKKHLSKGSPFVIRFRSPGILNNRIIVNDIVRGSVETNDNFIDIVLLKSIGMPTYHLAHVVDDYLMGTTHVVRADERFASVPLHIQLFNSFGFEPPIYVHTSPLLKQEGNSKRKLSKRKDPEADLEYYYKDGYPIFSIIDYLYTIIDSFYEDWKKENPGKNFNDYKIDLGRLSISGALLNIDKLKFLANDYLSSLNTLELYNQGLLWTKEYDAELYNLMIEHEEYTINALNIERHIEKDPKRFTLYTDLKPQLELFYDETYNSKRNNIELPVLANKDLLVKLYDFYSSNYTIDLDKIQWFDLMKQFASKNNFALNNQEFKSGNYIGKVGDVAMILRLVLMGSKVTPDLWESMKVLGKDRVLERMKKFIE
ncbi:MAG: glutamate--tRNA ligase, partial [Candidatus Absconditabacteria bacterium]